MILENFFCRSFENRKRMSLPASQPNKENWVLGVSEMFV